MISSAKLAGRMVMACATAVSSVLDAAQTPVPAPAPVPAPVVDTWFPVGHWIPEHPSQQSMGFWWEFRADGTLTMSFGTLVTDHTDRSGDTFMTPSGMAGGNRFRARYTIHNDVLSVDTGASQLVTYSRIGRAPNPGDPLIGRWRPIPRPTEPGGGANFDRVQQVMASKGILVFTPDGMQYLRVPIGTREGTWDKQAHTFHLQPDSVSYAFGRMNSKLLLAQPPDGGELESYVPDPLPPAAIEVPTAPKIGQQAGTPPADRVVPPAPRTVRPQVLHSVEASFSDEARARKIQGSVRVQLYVEADGRIRNVRVTKSAADAYSNPKDREAALTLDQKAIEAVTQYRFAPGMVDGKPAPMSVNVEISFYLY